MREKMTKKVRTQVVRTAYGKIGLQEYLRREVAKGNLVRIKNGTLIPVQMAVMPLGCTSKTLRIMFLLQIYHRKARASSSKERHIRKRQRRTGQRRMQMNLPKTLLKEFETAFYY